MSDKAFFDTNVLVYVVGHKDERTATAEALVANGGIVSVQVPNELVIVLVAAAGAASLLPAVVALRVAPATILRRE